MSSCPDILRLQSLADGQCDQPEARALTDHAASCAACAEKLRELRRACLPLHLLTEAPPVGLEARLREATRGVRPLAALTCEEALEGVSLRLDGELDHAAAQRLEAHLLACATCYRAATEMEIAAGVLRATEPEAAPADLLARIQVAAELAAPARPAPVRAPLLRRWGMALGSAAAAAAILLAMFVHSLAPVTQAPVPMVASAPPAPVVVAAEPTPTAPVPAPSAVTPGPPAIAAARPVRASEPTHVATARPAATPALPARVASAPPSRTVTPPRLPTSPASPSGAVVVPGAPTSVAVAPPVLPDVRVAQPTLAALPPTHTDVAAPATPRAAPSGPSRAAADVPKPTPAEAPARPAAAPTPTRTRSNWVSRPVSAEREIYRSDDVSPRLADARGELARDTRDMTLYRSPGITIIR